MRLPEMYEILSLEGAWCDRIYSFANVTKNEFTHKSAFIDELDVSVNAQRLQKSAPARECYFAIKKKNACPALMYPMGN